MIPMDLNSERNGTEKAILCMHSGQSVTVNYIERTEKAGRLKTGETKAGKLF